MIRVFIADDHSVVRDGIRLHVESEPDMEVCGEAEQGEELLQLAPRQTWDVLTLDLNMPGTSGLQLIPRLLEVQPALGIVVYSVRGENSFAVSVLRAGAKAYLSKDRSPTELIAAMRRVAAGGRYVTQELAELMLEQGLGGSADPFENLSDREEEVFQLLVDGRMPIDIATQLHLSPSTVTTYVARIKSKLGVSTLSEIVQYAYRRGLAR